MLRHYRQARRLAAALAVFIFAAAVSADDGLLLCSAWKRGRKTAEQPCSQIAAFDAGLNDTIVVKINRLDELLAQAGCRDRHDQPLPPAELCAPQKIMLYIDGRKVSERDPSKDGLMGMERDTIEFPLQLPATDADNVWIELLGGPKKDFFLKPSQIQVGLERGYVLPGVIDFKLIRLNKFWFYFCMGMIGLFLAAGLILAHRSDILRESGPAPAAGRKPWSLARCQMAFWLFLVVNAFMFIWLVTGAVNTITEGVLGLMGIGFGTALGSALIDASEDRADKIDKIKIRQTALKAELDTIDQKLAAASGDAFLLQQKTQTETDLRATFQQLEALTTPPASRGFFIDIVSGPSGVTLHRFQMVLWTTLLGIIFAYSVWKSLAMPDFDATLLALQGISAGTYLGFKFPEKAAAPPSRG